ncbi:MAG TPA: GNAT family N-acetyltransferase [Herpetosiphonaceae bacterium]|nr:GNAT family N-acetyltransferase [Herpetosiphonaceae bacterium]
MTWQIHPEPDDAVLRKAMGEERLWSAYAINDLRSPFRERSTFNYATKGKQWAILLEYRTTTFNGLLPFGAPAGVAALLEAKGDSLPRSCIIPTHSTQMQEVLAHAYTFAKQEPMYRMVADRQHFKHYESGVTVEALDPSHIGEIEAFYTINNAPTFSPDQVYHGIYAGVRRHGVLVAVGGTHFVSPADQLCALGNVYTDAMLRGNGYVRTIISWLTQAVLERGCDDVVLNVHQNDFGAQQMYEPLGFKHVVPFWETAARKR